MFSARDAIALSMLGLIAAGCSSQTTRSEARGAYAPDQFDTAEPFSARTLTQADLAGFLATHPAYRQDSAHIASFYEERGMHLAWIVGDSASSYAEAFVTQTEVGAPAAEDAPPTVRRLNALYDGFVDGTRASCSSCATELDLLLTAEFLRADRTGGAVHGRDLGMLIPRTKRDFARLIDSLGRSEAVFRGYDLELPQYQALKEQLRRYAKLTDETWAAVQLPARRKALRIRDTAAVIPEIRERLTRLGDLEPAGIDSASRTRYDSTLAAAVKQFQRRHGFNDDAVIDSAFMRALSIAPSVRMRTMLINMERLRWSPRVRDPNALVVNIPDFRLRVYENGSEVMNMAVVVGDRATRTVLFRDTLTQIVFSPSWTIPKSIVVNEILPAMDKDPSYLETRGMKIIGGTDEIPEIRQEPGPMNPLGHVKFLFPNSYSIYMHDTPAKGLFRHEERAASHGCIRLAEADKLAEYLLRNEPEWSRDRIHGAMTSGREQVVRLKEPRPVSIVYFTAWVDDQGLVHFREDIYGHDARFVKELFS
jgi:murein L,D-transpeptidase YcbB/YkuD